MCKPHTCALPHKYETTGKSQHNCMFHDRAPQGAFYNQCMSKIRWEAVRRACSASRNLAASMRAAPSSSPLPSPAAPPQA